MGSGGGVAILMKIRLNYGLKTYVLITKMPIDYSNACIYKICCKDLSVKDVYVGSTTNFVQRCQRRRDHKAVCNNEKGRDYNYYVYQFIRENGGWDNWEA